MSRNLFYTGNDMSKWINILALLIIIMRVTKLYLKLHVYFLSLSLSLPHTHTSNKQKRKKKVLQYLFSFSVEFFQTCIFLLKAANFFFKLSKFFPKQFRLYSISNRNLCNCLQLTLASLERRNFVFMFKKKKRKEKYKQVIQKKRYNIDIAEYNIHCVMITTTTILYLS